MYKIIPLVLVLSPSLALANELTLMTSSENPAADSEVAVSVGGTPGIPFGLAIGSPAVGPSHLEGVGPIAWELSTTRLLHTGVTSETPHQTILNIPATLVGLDFTTQAVTWDESSNASTLSISPAPGPSVFDPIATPPVPQMNARNPAIGDVNNDGLPDIYVPLNSTSGASYQNQLLFGVQTESGFEFQNVTNSHLPLNQIDPAYQAVFVDLNQDNYLDVVVASGATGIIHPNPEATKNKYFINDGTGRFSYGGEFSVADYSGTVATGDINGDGTIDVVFGDNNFGEGGIENAYLNDGAGNFTHLPFAFQNESEPYSNTSRLTLGDFDNDGDLDLVSVDFNNDGRSRLYLNEKDQAGQPMFIEKVDAFSSWTTSSGADVVTGDFNSDGHLDMIQIFLTNSQSIKILINDGNANFELREPTNMLLGSPAPLDIDLGDLDGDGDLDAVISTAIESKEDFFLLNDGNGNFSRPDENAEITGIHYLARYPKIVDLDGDHVTDILYVTGAAQEVVLPLLRQTAAQAQQQSGSDTSNAAYSQKNVSPLSLEEMQAARTIFDIGY